MASKARYLRYVGFVVKICMKKRLHNFAKCFFRNNSCEILILDPFRKIASKMCLKFKCQIQCLKLQKQKKIAKCEKQQCKICISGSAFSCFLKKKNIYYFSSYFAKKRSHFREIFHTKFACKIRHFVRNRTQLFIKNIQIRKHTI